MIIPSEIYEALFRCVGCLNNSNIVIFNDFFKNKNNQECNKANKTQGITVCYVNWVIKRTDTATKLVLYFNSWSRHKKEKKKNYL